MTSRSQTLQPAAGDDRDGGAIERAQPTIGLALGGGGARGLGHVVMLEAFDELGLRPSLISGTSIGAVIGAAYASGMTARQIRAHMEELLSVRLELVRDLFSARAKPRARVAGIFAQRYAVLSPEALLEVIYPPRVARSFEDLEIPFKIVATDFYGLEPIVFSQGPLRRAVAASMALPMLFEPVLVGDRACIDGGLVNPLPFDLLKGCDVTVAIDVSGTPVSQPDRAHPTATEALFAASFIFERTIIREKLKSERPDIYMQAGTNHFQLLDIWKVRDILSAAEDAKANLKAKLTRILSSETIATPSLPPPTAEDSGVQTRNPASPRLKRNRPILRRLKALRAQAQDQRD